MRYIDADKLKDVKFIDILYTPSIDKDGAYRIGWNDAIDAIVDNEPTADVRENVRGEWIERKPVHLGKVIKGFGSIFVCSVCGEEVDCKPYNFCPNCGAQMRIEKQIFHDAIDNTPMAEDVFVGIKEKLHKVVDEFNREKGA